MLYRLVPVVPVVLEEGGVGVDLLLGGPEEGVAAPLPHPDPGVTVVQGHLLNRTEMVLDIKVTKF